MFEQISRSLIATPFQPVNIEAVAKRLNLTLRGREDGAKEIPAPNAPNLAAAELDVVGDIKAERDRCVEQLAGQLRAIQGALAQIDTHMNIAKMRQDTDAAIADFRALAHGVETDVAEMRGRARDARVEFERFRGTHRLDRGARVPARRGNMWYWLLVVTLLEVVLNGVFLAAGSDQGLIGGMAIAVGLSLINVWIVGVVGGFGVFRFAHHRRLSIKLPAILFGVALVGAVVVLNLFVARFRDLYGATEKPPEISAIFTDMLQNPSHFAGIESLLLFVIGLACASFSVWKFFGHDDPYPGYGAMHRRRVEAEKAHANARRALLEDATEIRDALLADFTRAMDQMRAYAEQRAQALASRARYTTLYEAHESELEQAGRRLLAMYRGANTNARKMPAPPHFATVFTFPDKGTRHPAIVALLTDPPAPPNPDDLMRELEALRRTGMAAFDNVIAMLPAEAS